MNDREGAQKYFAQAARLAALREGVEVYYQTDLENLVVYDRPGNTFVAGVSGIYRPYVGEQDARGLLIPLKGKAERAATAETPAGLVRQALERYAAVIHETGAHPDALTVKGRYTARAPYCCKYLLSYLLAFHEAQGVDLASARTEYEQLNRQLTVLEDRGGSAFRGQVFAELQFFVENYWRVVRRFSVAMPPLRGCSLDASIADVVPHALLLPWEYATIWNNSAATRTDIGKVASGRQRPRGSRRQSPGIHGDPLEEARDQPDPRRHEFMGHGDRGGKG